MIIHHLTGITEEKSVWFVYGVEAGILRCTKMSTKIYNAYRFPKTLGLFDVMSKIKEDGLKVVK